MIRRRHIPLPQRYRSRIQKSSYVYGFFAVVVIGIGYLWTQTDAQSMQQSNALISFCTDFNSAVKGRNLTKFQLVKLQNFYKKNCPISANNNVSTGSTQNGTGTTIRLGGGNGIGSESISMQVAGTNIVSDTQKIYGQEIAVDLAIDTILRRVKRMQVRQDTIFEDTTKTRVKIPQGTIVQPAKDDGIDPATLTLQQKPMTDKSIKQFMFGVDNKHLVFSQPVKIELPVEGYVDGKQLPILVKHAGDTDYNTNGLSLSADTQCTSTGATTKPSNIATVQNGKITFYTCGASYFMAGYTGGNTTTNYTDNTTKNFTTTIATGTNMPIGSRIKEISVVVDWQAIAGTNPAAPGTANCYPNEKGYSIVAPNGYSAVLVKTGTMTTSQSNCPRSVYTFVMTGITGHPTTILSAGTYRVATGSAGLTGLFNANPFGTWTLRVQDTAASDGVILWGFKVQVTGNVAPSNFALSNSSIVEGLPTNTLIGNLSSTDADTGDLFTYSFDTTCTGTYNNAQFLLSGNQLRSSVVFDYAVQQTARVCLKSSDQRGDFVTGVRDITLIMTGFVKEISPNSLPFPSLPTSLSTQTLDYTFSGAGQAFMVQDTKGADTGYATTIQMSGNLIAPGGYTIANTDIGIVGTPAVFLASGVANTNVQPTTASSTPFRALSSAQSLIRRNNGANFIRRGTYGVYLPLRINIPAAQPAGSYQGTLIYTLIEN